MKHSILKILVCICIISIFVCDGRRNHNRREENNENDQIEKDARQDNPIRKFEVANNDPKLHQMEQPGNRGSYLREEIRGGRPRGHHLPKEHVRKEHRDRGRKGHRGHKWRRGHKRGVFEMAKKIFLGIILFASMIVFLLGLIFVGVKIVKRLLRCKERRRLRKEQRRMMRQSQARHCQCNCINNPGALNNTLNNQSTALPMVSQPSLEYVNNSNSINHAQDYELLNVNSDINSRREINNMRPEITYPKLDQVNSCHNDFYRHVRNSNHSSRPAAEHLISKNNTPSEK